MHLLLLLVECMKELGPTAGFDTERYAVEFCPLRDTGPHVPLSELNALSLFQLFFDHTGVNSELYVCVCRVQEE